MKRFFAKLSYCGATYHGWQRQGGVPTIQGTVAELLEKLLRTPIEVSGSSRTDKGVHALGQVAHLDIPDEVDPAWLCDRLGRMLPPTICLHGLYPVAAEAHARFDAVARSYFYLCTTERSPFWSGMSLYLPYRPDIEKMNLAAADLLGEQDFRSFCKGAAGLPHHLCRVFSARWEERDGWLVFRIQASRFLHGMVRTVVGTMLAIGRGALRGERAMQQVVAARDRCAARESVAPHGLFLERVHYPAAQFPFLQADKAAPEAWSPAFVWRPEISDMDPFHMGPSSLFKDS